jgi:hypothetical protein
MEQAVYVICTTTSKASSTTLNDVRECQGPTDKESMRSSFTNLLGYAQTGLQFEKVYDEKRCHQAHSYQRNGKEEKIWRIWGTGTIRIYFIYLPLNRIVVLKTKPKRTDKLSKGEKEELETLANFALDCLEQYSFEDRELL